MSVRADRRPPPPTPGAPPTLPELLEAELPGGLRTVVVRRPSVPLVEVRLAFPLPISSCEHRAEPLVLVESLLAGTPNRDRSSIAAAAQRCGGQIAAELGHDRIVVTASALAAHAGELFSLLAEILAEASYADDAVAADRARAAEEILLVRSEPSVIVDEAFDRRFHRGHPYSAGLPAPSTVRRVRAAQLSRRHRQVIQPTGAALVVVGEVEPARLLEELGQRLGPWLATGVCPETLPSRFDPPAFSQGSELVPRPGAHQSNLRIGGPAPRREDAAWPAAALANLAFGGVFSSRLVANLRERRGYTYSPRSGVQHRLAGSRFVVTLDVGTEVTAPALAEVRYELAHAALLGFEEAEIEGARRYAVGSFALATATQAGLASTLAGVVLDGLGPGYLESHPRALLGVTGDDVNDAARELLSPAAMTTVVLGDAAVVERQLGVLGPVVLRRS
jgi:zinc protease